MTFVSICYSVQSEAREDVFEGSTKLKLEIGEMEHLSPSLDRTRLRAPSELKGFCGGVAKA